MKTEVKFRDLPEKVQGFLRREAQESYNIRNEESYSINLESLHSLKEWKEATDDERLAYAEWRYPVGTNSCCVSSNGTPGIIISKPYLSITIDVKKEDGGILILYAKCKGWAEIVSLPDIKEASPSAQQEFVKANPGMQHVEEPKAGDMVEGSNGNGWELAKFTGGTLSSGDFICEDTKYDGKRSLRNSIMFYEEIRLPKKSEVEMKAKQLMLNYSGHNEIPAANYKHDSVMKMLTQAIKWGQANPDKI